MSALKTETLLIGGGVIVGGLLLLKLAGKASSIAQHSTDASGNPVTAYQGAGALGTAGAVANAASGGIFATIGDWLGGGLYDATHTDPMATTPPMQAAPPNRDATIDKYTQGGNASSGSGSVDLFQDPAMFGWNWGG